MSLTALFMPSVGILANGGYKNNKLQNIGSDTKGLHKMLRIMKLTAIIILMACISASATGYTQQVTIKVKNASLKEVFKEIKKQTGYTFAYSEASIKDAKKVSLELRNASIEQVLNVCLKDQPFSYEIVEKIVVIKYQPKSPNEDTNLRNEPPPPIDITGKVTDADGNPLAGASVKVKGSSLGTTTNNEGVFTLKGVNENATLEISFVGYETYTIAVANKTSIAASLKLKPESLNEVVINKGYYKTNRITEVGNVSTVTAKEIEKQPVNNILLALQGRVPGMDITQQTGLPGGAIKIQIRGQNSLQNGTLPLYVIDGVPYLNENLPNLSGDILRTSGSFSRSGNPLSYINISDVESVDVLKDADATAIYGSRGANGVVLITTKRGKQGKLKMNANFQTGFGKVANMIPLLNTQQYLEMRREAFRNDGVSTIPASAYDLKLWDTTRYTDWQKELIGGTATVNQAQVTVSGGTGNTVFLTSGTYRKETTVFPGNMSNRQGSLLMNLNSSSLNRKFRINVSTNYVFSDNRLMKVDFTGYALTIAPNAPALYNSDGTINWAPNPTSGSGTWLNPVASFVNNKFKNVTNNLVSNAILSYTIIDGLEIKSSFGYNNLQSNEKITEPSTSKDPARWQNLGTTLRKSNFANNRVNSWIIEPQISYNKSVLGGQLALLAGSTIQQNSSSGQQINAEGFSSDLLIEDPSFATNSNVAKLYFSQYKYNAIFGRLSYNWKEKYLTNFTARRDGTSRFGPANRFHNFLAAGIGWVFSKENFFGNNIPFLSFGKIRGSYGTTGSDAVGDYSFLDLYSSTGAGVPYQATVGLQLNRLFTPDLAWEETKKFEIGLELGFLGDRLFITASRYENNSSNQLTSYSLPSVTGFSSIQRNLPADIRNKGWEFTLNTVNISSRAFKWTSTFNISWNRNKLVDVDTLSNYRLFIGRPLGSFYVYKYAGVNPTTGLYGFYDGKGNIVTNPNAATDLTKLIDVNPKYFGGFLNTIQFKDFQLDLLFQFVKQTGRDYLYNAFPGYFGNINYGNQPKTVLTRWQKPGDVVGNIQRLNQDLNIYSGYDYAALSDQVYTDISFVKLKNVSLSWQIPSPWKNKLRLQSSRIYVQGQNLLTFTKYKGFDPETQSVGSLPPLRIITAGVQIGL